MAQVTSTTGAGQPVNPGMGLPQRAAADATITPAARLGRGQHFKAKKYSCKEIRIILLQSWQVKCGCRRKMPGVHRDLEKASQEISRVMAANGVFVTILPANSQLTNAAFRLLPGRAEKDFRGRRQRMVPAPRRYFEAERVSFWPRRSVVPRTRVIGSDRSRRRTIISAA